MRIDQSHPDFDKKIILLNGKFCRIALAADDVEGWVEMPDLAALAPLPEDLKATENFDTDFAPGSEEVREWEEIKVLRKLGKVEIIDLPQ